MSESGRSLLKLTHVGASLILVRMKIYFRHHLPKLGFTDGILQQQVTCRCGGFVYFYRINPSWERPLHPQKWESFIDSTVRSGFMERNIKRVIVRTFLKFRGLTWRRSSVNAEYGLNKSCLIWRHVHHILLHHCDHWMFIRFYWLWNETLCSDFSSPGAGRLRTL